MSLARLALALFMLALTFGSTPAREGDAEPQPRNRRIWYIRAYTGVGLTRDSDLGIRMPGRDTEIWIDGVSWEDNSLSTDWSRESIPYVGVRGGFYPRKRKHLGLSFEVLHFKIFAEAEKSYPVSGTFEGAPIDTVAPMNQFVQVYQVTNGVNMLLLNLEAHQGLAKNPRFVDGRAELYAGLGAGPTITYTTSSIDGVGQQQYDLGRLGSQLFGGFLWRVSRRWDISLEYKFTATTVDGGIVDGTSQSKLRTQHFTVGFGYRFQKPRES